MSAHIHSFLLALTVGFVYAWLQHPTLGQFSLQAFAFAALLYFGLKRLNNAKIWHITPAYISFEMIIATFAFLLLIGSTGNTTSLFYPLTYLHLFFLVLATHVSTSIITTGMLVLFHYGLTPSLSSTEISQLLTIPMMTILFLFAKQQHEEVIKERAIIEADEHALAQARNHEFTLMSFLTTYLPQKIAQVKHLTQNAALNKDAITGQLTLLEIETANMVQKIESTHLETPTPDMNQPELAPMPAENTEP